LGGDPVHTYALSRVEGEAMTPPDDISEVFVNQFDADAAGKQVYVVCTITVSGSYTTGGDTLTCGRK
jgi:hypothetical protein